MSSRNLVPIGDGLRRPPLPTVKLVRVELVVSLLESVFEERDEDLSEDGWRLWRKRIFSGGSWNLDVALSLASPMRIGFGGEIRESNGEMITLSTLTNTPKDPASNPAHVIRTHLRRVS